MYNLAYNTELCSKSMFKWLNFSVTYKPEHYQIQFTLNYTSGRQATVYVILVLPILSEINWYRL